MREPDETSDLNPGNLLWPKPQSITLATGQLDLTWGLRVVAESSAEASRLQATLNSRGLLKDDGLELRLALDAAASEHPEGYRLKVESDGIAITAPTTAGLFYGGATLLQLCEDDRLEPRASLRCLHIEDWPSLAHRGFMLDISRDRVPRLDFLFEWIERLAGLKLNELQLYMEHTFAYPGHEAVWGSASPFTGEELRALDAHCKKLHVTLIPNQQSFGHLHRWLKLPQYRHLAEHPEGIEHPFSLRAEPFGLSATDPASLRFLEGLYDSLLPNFTSTEFHVGLDEALDLGLGGSKAECEKLGRGRVFTNYLNSVHKLVSERGKRMQFWADEVEGDAGLARRLPTDAIANLWGYEAGHPFEENAERFREAGLELRVCPGTSSWQSLSGRTHNVIQNLSEATRAANSVGATGLTICDWGDRGHLQPPSVSELGLAVGAGLAWNEAGSEPLDRESVATILDRHVFKDPSASLGKIFYDLGCVHEPLGGEVRNATALFFLLIHAGESHPHERTAGLDLDGFAESEMRIEKLCERLTRSDSKRRDASLIRDEALWVLRTLRIATRLGAARAADPASKTCELPSVLRAALARDLQDVQEQQRNLWLLRSRPGGLEDSLLQLTQTLSALESPKS